MMIGCISKPPTLKSPKLSLDTLKQDVVTVLTPLGSVCHLRLDDKEPYSGESFRQQILSKVHERKWYVLAVGIDELTHVYYANGWKLVHELLTKSKSSLVLNNSIADYLLYRTKIIKAHDSGETHLKFKLLCRKSQLLPEKSFFRSYLAALDESLDPNVRREHCRKVAFTKQKKIKKLESLNICVPVSHYRWLERAVNLNDAFSAILLGSKIIRATNPNTPFSLRNNAVFFAKHYFDTALKIISCGHDNPYTQLVKILRDSDEKDQTREELLVLVHHLELFYLCLKTIDSKDIALEIKSFDIHLSPWFQYPDSHKQLLAKVWDEDQLSDENNR